jgi:hypothetical protein
VSYVEDQRAICDGTAAQAHTVSHYHQLRIRQALPDLNLLF